MKHQVLLDLFHSPMDSHKASLMWRHFTCFKSQQNLGSHFKSPLGQSPFQYLAFHGFPLRQKRFQFTLGVKIEYVSINHKLYITNKTFTLFKRPWLMKTTSNISMTKSIDQLRLFVELLKVLFCFYKVRVVPSAGYSSTWVDSSLGVPVRHLP